jgi:hypothetical protein
MRNLKPFLAAALAVCSMAAVGAPAQSQGLPLPPLPVPPLHPAFPVDLDHVARGTSGGLANAPGIRLTWRAMIPGLSFCVAYSTAHGASLAGTAPYGHLDSSDLTHCLIAGRDGTATDFVRIEDEDATQDPLLIATVVMVDDQVKTSAIRLAALPALKR